MEYVELIFLSSNALIFSYQIVLNYIISSKFNILRFIDASRSSRPSALTFLPLIIYYPGSSLAFSTTETHGRLRKWAGAWGGIFIKCHTQMDA